MRLAPEHGSAPAAGIRKLLRQSSRRWKTSGDGAAAAVSGAGLMERDRAGPRIGWTLYAVAAVTDG